MSRLTLLSLAFIAFLSVSALNAQETPEVAACADTIEWVDINDALQRSVDEKKKILIDFYADWCGWCKKMDKTTYADSAVIAYLNDNYLTVKLNPEKHGSVELDGTTYSGRQFAQAMSVTGYPATGFINESNEVITLLTGYREAGQFLSVLRYIAEDHYLTISFDEFLAMADEPQAVPVPAE